MSARDEWGSRDVDRFWSKVDISQGPDARWPWNGGVDKDGYGSFQTGGKGRQRKWRAHRFALIATGSDPGPITMHTCDSPGCCNPAHLRAGTHDENRKDCARKARTARGETHPKARLTADAVRDIREAIGRREPLARIAARYGVAKCTVSAIGTGRNWGWMT